MNKHINILFAILGLLALAGCEDPAMGTQVSGASGAVVVTIAAPGTAAASGARTIYPALDGFTRYELSFEGPAAHEPVAISIGVNSPIGLTVGTWTITATAYSGADGSETAAARESATVTISTDATTPVSIILVPVPEGSNGTFSYSVTSPSGATGSLTIQTISGGAVTGGVVALAAGTTSAMSLPPGEYMLFVSLTKAGNHAGRADVLHIYSGLTSVASYTFTGDDFIGVETLNPEYADFTSVAGATVLPSNAATINAAKGGNTAVFAIVGGGTNVATINEGTGELTLVGPGEIRVSLVIATASGVVTHIGTSDSITIPTVSGVTVSPATVNVAKGGTTTFSATVTGINNPAQTVTWFVSGGNSGTAISAGGILSVAADESAAILTVMATSAVDTAKSGTAVVTVTAPPLPTSGTLVERLAWLSSYAADGGDYTIELNANETIDPATLFYNGKTVTVTLKGDTAERTVSLGSTGSLFTVDSGVTLTLDNNVTLQGRSDNTASLVRVNSGGTLAMKGNAKITGNTAFAAITSSSNGGGVYVSGNFTMSGSASVYGNTASAAAYGSNSYGGGVYVSDGSFTMSGNASVYGNTASSSTTSSSSTGGGVYVSGSFTMSGSASVYDNTASSSTAASGGGVYVDGSFTMGGNASVYGNMASAPEPSFGGGVYVNYNCIFTMSDSAWVYDNTAFSSDHSVGGGVCVYGSFTMSDSASIYSNTASSSGSFSVGGGVSSIGVTFTMSGSASVYGNTVSSTAFGSSSFGGGVYVQNSNFIIGDSASVYGNTASGSSSYGGGMYFNTNSNENFTKTGGVIYGSNETNPALRNIVKNSEGVEQTGQGAAVYVDSTHRRETTVSAAQNLSVTSDGTFTGQWDDPAAVGSANITIGSNYGTITITGSDGVNTISKSGVGGKPISLTLNATAGYTGVVWYVDGVWKAADDSVTINATSYPIGRHTVTFTGKRDGNLFSQLIPFAVVE